MKKINIILTAAALVIVFTFLGIKVIFNLAGKNAAEFVGDFRPDAGTLEDGSYTGHFGYMNDRFEASVKFIIEDKKLLGCDFNKLFGTPGYDAPYTVSTEIDRTKKLDFDAVSGATLTSNLAKAAIKDAIDKGPERID